jgi:hypothetical protein
MILRAFRCGNALTRFLFFRSGKRVVAAGEHRQHFTCCSFASNEAIDIFLVGYQGHFVHQVQTGLNTSNTTLVVNLRSVGREFHRLVRIESKVICLAHASENISFIA